MGGPGLCHSEGHSIHKFMLFIHSFITYINTCIQYHRKGVNSGTCENICKHFPFISRPAQEFLILWGEFFIHPFVKPLPKGSRSASNSYQRIWMHVCFSWGAKLFHSFQRRRRWIIFGILWSSLIQNLDLFFFFPRLVLTGFVEHSLTPVTLKPLESQSNNLIKLKIIICRF